MKAQMNVDRDGFPLVRLGLFRPFVQELERRGINYDNALERSEIARQMIHDDNAFVPAMVMYRLVEDAARDARDPYLGVAVGESLVFAAWSPFIEAVARSSFLADFLLRFVMSAKKEASSARYLLESSPDVGAFRECRVQRPKIAPKQVDAFTATYTLKLIRQAIGENWDPGQVRVTVCSPEALPPKYQGVEIVEGGRMGVVVRFPAEWLLYEIDRMLFADSIRHSTIAAQLPSSFIDSLRSTLRSNTTFRDMRIETVARLCGLSRQSLQRKLRAAGTTFSDEVIALKRERACEALVSTREPVKEIAASLGFDSAANFSRSFKSWTGKSPREYRNSK